jgi:hypothetical protein
MNSRRACRTWYNKDEISNQEPRKLKNDNFKMQT